MGEATTRTLRPLLVVLLASVVVLAGCSTTEDLGFAGTSTTLRLVQDEDLGDETSASAEQMQGVIDQLLASDDACAILTQRALQTSGIDPAALLSAGARRVLAQGIVDIYDHLIELVGDPVVRPALQVQSNTYAQVLQIVDRYANSPSSARAAQEIQTLTQTPEFVTASQTVTAWVTRNC